MVAAHDAHLGAAALSRAHDGAAGGIEHLHEAQRAGGARLAAFDVGAGGADRGKVEADAATLFLGEGGLLDCFENTVDGVIDLVHYEAVEHRNFSALRTRVCDDASAGEELESGHDAVEFFFPFRGIGFICSYCMCHPFERIIRCIVFRKIPAAVITILL